MGAPGSIRAVLADDHDRLDALLRASVNEAGEIDRDAYAEFRAGILRHIGIEEKVLFPASRTANGGTPLPMVAQLHREHGALALLLVPTPNVALIGEIRSILEDHNAREEGPGGVYEACDRLLGPDLDAVLEQLRAYPPVKVAPHHDGPEVPRSAAEALRAVGSPRRSGG